MDVVRFEKIKDKIIELRGEKVILDSDVAELYGVKTREVNQAVSNNPDKFPEGYIFELNKDEKLEVVKIFDHLDRFRFKYSPYLPKAFTECGLIIETNDEKYKHEGMILHKEAIELKKIFSSILAKSE